MGDGDEVEWEDRGKVAGTIRRYFYAPDGQPPDGWELARCLSVAKTMKRHGESEEDICDAVRGAAIMRDEGRLGKWVRPGDKMTMRTFITAKRAGVSLYRLGLHVVQKRESHKSEHAMAAISEALEAAAGRTGEGNGRGGSR